jgi:UDP-N-acetylenolpyruvoylglucosamine reductase
MALARTIAAGVRERFAIDLTPEPVLIGHRWSATCVPPM